MGSSCRTFREEPLARPCRFLNGALQPSRQNERCHENASDCHAVYLRDCLRGAPCPGFYAQSPRYYGPPRRYYGPSPSYGPPRYYGPSPYDGPSPYYGPPQRYYGPPGYY